MKRLILALLLTSSGIALGQSLPLGQPLVTTGQGPAAVSIQGAETVTVTSTSCNTLTASGCSVGPNGPNVGTLNLVGSPGGAFTVAVSISRGHQICFSNSTGQAGTVGGGGGTTVVVPNGTGISSTAPICVLSLDGTNYVQVGSSAAITALTGDVTATGPGSAAATLANTGIVPGIYTNANVTFDAKGRATAASNGSNFIHVVQPVAEWAFDAQTSSLTSEPDVSGSNFCSGAPCNLTMNGSNFARDPQGGIDMNTYATCGGSFCATPSNMQSPLTTWTTAIFRACPGLTPQNLSQISYGYSTIFGTTASQGVDFLLGPSYSTSFQGNTSSYQLDGSTSPGTFSLGISGFETMTGILSAGCNTYAMVLDTQDHAYINGQETSYIFQGATSSQRASTSPYGIGIGLFGQGSFSWMGTILYGEIFNSVLTPAQIQSETNYINHKAGPDTQIPHFNQTSVSQAVFIGDSITQCLEASNCYPENLTLNQSFNIQNWGSGGDTACDLAYSAPYRGLTSVSLQSPYSVISIFSGTNDMGVGSATPAYVWGCLKHAIVSFVQLGTPKIFVWTMLDRTGGTSPVSNANRDSYNTFIRQNVPSYGSQVVLVDAAENPNLGADGASANPAYWNTDQLHPNNAGQTILSAAGSAAINSAYGSNAGAPDYQTGTATLTYANNYEIAAFTSNGTLTLRPCAFLTGSTVTVVNPQSTFTVAVAPNGSDLINGGSSSVPIPANKTVVFLDMLTAASTGGCSWVIQ